MAGSFVLNRYSKCATGKASHEKTCSDHSLSLFVCLCLYVQGVREHADLYGSVREPCKGACGSICERAGAHRSVHELPQLRTCEHPEPDRTLSTAPLWERTNAHLQAPKARSNTSYRTSLGDDCCALTKHPEPDRTPHTAPLWETTLAHLRAPRYRSNTSYRTSLGEDCCTLASTQSQIKNLLSHLAGRRQLYTASTKSEIKHFLTRLSERGPLRTCEHPEQDHLLPRLSARRLVRTCEHPERDRTPPAASLWDITIARLRAPKTRSRTSYRASLGEDCCALASTQSQIKNLLPCLSGRGLLRTCEHPEPDQEAPTRLYGRGLLRTCEHPEPDQEPPTAPRWDRTDAHLRAPRARSRSSYRASLGEAWCALASTQSQMKNLLPRLSGRGLLHTCEHPEPDQEPPTTPLWERTVAHLRAPRVKSRSFYHASLGEDCCVLASTQSQIKKLLPRLPGRRLLRTCEHPEPHQEPPTTHLWETTLAHLRAPRARSRTSYHASLGEDWCALASTQSQISSYRASLGDSCCALASTQSQIKSVLPRPSGRELVRTCEHPEPNQENSYCNRSCG